MIYELDDLIIPTKVAYFVKLTFFNTLRPWKRYQNSKPHLKEMLQFPAFMTQNPTSTRIIPTSLLLPPQWPQPHSEELLLAIEESEFEEKYNDIRKINNNLIVIGKTSVENDKEDFENDADEDEADNAEESEGDEFEQETG